MDNSIFNLSNYISMLEGALCTGYSFISFDNEKISRNISKRCLLRHDVDADISAALTMARADHKIGISSTYFLMIRSPMYNLTSRHNSNAINEIIKLGHKIGLHYDQGFDFNFLKSDVYQIRLEAEFIQNMFGERITTVSFHQPNESVLNGDISIGNYLNTYDKDYLRFFKYHSDSNRKFNLHSFSHDKTDNIFSNLSSMSIQLLIHPMWWVYDSLSTEDVWDKVIESNFNKSQSQLLETELKYGVKRRIKIKKS